MDMKRVHPQGRGRRPSKFPAISQGEEVLISFSPHFRDSELHPRRSRIPIFHIVARDASSRRVCPSYAERFLPFGLFLGFFCRMLIYLQTFISLPPTRPPCRPLPFRSSDQSFPHSPSAPLDSRRRNESLCFVWDLCLVLYSILLHCRSLLARRTWHIGYSGYHLLLPEPLGWRPLLAGIDSWFVGDIWEITLGGLPSAQLWIPSTGLRSPVLDWILCPLNAWSCLFWRGR